jgi:hypothetical protein
MANLNLQRCNYFDKNYFITMICNVLNMTIWQTDITYYK